MKVVHASKAYWPHLGGVETVVKDLAEGTRRAGHDVQVVVADGPGVEVVNDVPVLRARRLATFRSIPVAPTYPLLLARQRGDILHVHEPSVLPELLLASAGSSLHRRFDRIVLSWHSDVIRQRILQVGFRSVLRRALDAVETVIVATPHHVTDSEILPDFAEKTVVVPYGIDPKRYRLDADLEAEVEKVRRRYRPPIVLFMGRLVYYKGIERLTSAAQNVGATFLLVGDGPLRDHAIASSPARSGRLHVLPPVTERQKLALLHACDVFTLPSTHRSEAFGIVQLEAMACGKPVVTFDLPTGVTWVNQDGSTGLVARLDEPSSLAETVSRLIEDPELRRRLGSGAESRAEELTLSRQIQGTLRTYGSEYA